MKHSDSGQAAQFQTIDGLHPSWKYSAQGARRPQEKDGRRQTELH